MKGTFAFSPGWFSVHFSASTASRASSFHEVTDHRSAATPQSSASSFCAFWIQGNPTPEASSWIRGASPLPETSGASA